MNVLHNSLIPVSFVQSYWLSTRSLLYLRLAMFIYLLIAFIYSTAVLLRSDGKYFFYFTILSFIGETVYFAVASFNTFHYLRAISRTKVDNIIMCKRTSSISFYSLKKTHHPDATSLSYRLGKIMYSPSRNMLITQQVLYFNIALFHILVPAIFWGFLLPTVDPSTLWSYVNVSLHMVDGLFFLIEFSVGRMILNWWGLLVDVILLVLYVSWSWIWHAISPDGSFIYPFLDPQDPKSKFLYLGIMFASIIIYLLLLLLHKGRDYLFS